MCQFSSVGEGTAQHVDLLLKGDLKSEGNKKKGGGRIPEGEGGGWEEGRERGEPVLLQANFDQKINLTAPIFQSWWYRGWVKSRDRCNETAEVEVREEIYKRKKSQDG